MIALSEIDEVVGEMCYNCDDTLQTYNRGLSDMLFDISQIEYCGEGNNTIVVSHFSLGVVLRLRKCGNEKGSSRKSIALSVPTGLGYRFLVALGRGLVRNMLVIPARKGFLMEVEKKIASSRPVFRACKGVDVAASHIVIGWDARRLPRSIAIYCDGPTLTVELKPKFGVIPVWPVTGLTGVVKTSAALFCLQQYHPSKRARWPTPSTYCPCDLFSGDRVRMIRCLKALLSTPQINIRIHSGSRVILSHEVDQLLAGLSEFFSSSPHLLNANGCRHQHTVGGDQEPMVANERERLCGRLTNLLVDALLLDLSNSHLLRPSATPVSKRTALLDRCNSSRFSTSCSLHGNCDERANSLGEDESVKANCGRTLPINSVLSRVLDAQLTGYQDIVFVWPHYKRVFHYLTSLGQTWESFTCTNDARRRPQVPKELRASFDVVSDYLSSLVARDCSIMITFQRTSADRPDWLPVIGGSDACFAVNPVIIDIDPKPLDKIDERLAREHSIVLHAMARRDGVTAR